MGRAWLLCRCETCGKCRQEGLNGLVSVLRLFAEPSSPQRSSQPAQEAYKGKQRPANGPKSPIFRYRSTRGSPSTPAVVASGSLVRSIDYLSSGDEVGKSISAGQQLTRLLRGVSAASLPSFFPPGSKRAWSTQRTCRLRRRANHTVRFCGG